MMTTRITASTEKEYLQKLLKQPFKGCLVTTKTMTVGATKVVVGTVGKVVLSRHRTSQHCAVLAAPHHSVEAITNPMTFLNFGLFA